MENYNYKENKLYSEMNIEELLVCRKKHIENPKFFLKLHKPPFYYTWLRMLNEMIEKKEAECTGI